MNADKERPEKEKAVKNAVEGLNEGKDKVTNDVLEDCRLAIERDPECVMAYWRRSTAYEEQSKWQDALEDLKKAFGLNLRKFVDLEKTLEAKYAAEMEECVAKLGNLEAALVAKYAAKMEELEAQCSLLRQLKEAA